VIGETIGHFRVDALAGEGGMGAVYRGFDTVLERPVALKVLLPGIAAEDEGWETLRREAKAAAAVIHPNIATIYDLKRHETRSVLVMEWVDGVELGRLNFVAADKWPRAIRILAQIASALDYAHASGVIHRDIKPSNILVTKLDVAKITDFGLAKISGISAAISRGTFVGSPAFASPEQLVGDPLDRRTDVFSLGATAYSMLTGRRPFDGDRLETILYQVVNSSHPAAHTLNPAMPEEMSAVLDKSLAKKPDERPMTAGQFYSELEAAFNEWQHAKEEPPPEPVVALDDALAVPSSKKKRTPVYTREQVLSAFFHKGRLRTYPSREVYLKAVLEEVAKCFAMGQRYSQDDVNRILGQIYHDHDQLRCDLVEHRLLKRRFGTYTRRTPSG
jgi:serine/threonine protein kinase